MRLKANEFPWRLYVTVRAMSVGPDNPRRRTAEDARGSRCRCRR